LGRNGFVQQADRDQRTARTFGTVDQRRRNAPALRQSLIDALAAADDFIFLPADDDTLAFTWMMRVPSVRRLFAGAHGHVLAASMEVRTHSRPRAERLRDRLLAIAGGNLVCRGLADVPAEPPAAGDES
jgi:hypothetical protein